MMTGVGASLPVAASSPARAVAALFADEDATERTYLEAFEAGAADRHAQTAVPMSPPGFPATLDAVMAQMAGMTRMLQKMAEDGAEMKLKVKAEKN